MTGQVITFYSYKGGTGRTMALANTACLLARGVPSDEGFPEIAPGRVLTVDWDLEAPGLHRYFGQPNDGSPGVLGKHTGIIELFELLEQESRNEKFERREAAWDWCQDFFRSNPPHRFIARTRIPGVDLLTAGVQGSDYSGRVNRFNWEGLFKRIPGLFESFAEHLAEQFDYVLVDSRTGISDTSGICTAALPEKLVVVFTPNTQSLTGLQRLVTEAVQYRERVDDWRPLGLFPLPSRLDASRPALIDQWRRGVNEKGGFQSTFEALFKDVLDLPACDLATYFQEVQIQHVPDYAFGEPIAVELERTDSRLSLTRSYTAFVRRLVFLSGAWEHPATALAERQIRESNARIEELIAGGKSKDATPVAREVLIAFLKNPEARPTTLPTLLARLARARFEAGMLTEGIEFAKGAVDVATRVHGEHSLAVADQWLALGQLLTESRDLDGAVDAYQRVIAVREAHVDADDDRVRAARQGLEKIEALRPRSEPEPEPELEPAFVGPSQDWSRWGRLASRYQRVRSRRLLSIDGSGYGVIATLPILKRIEDELRARSGIATLSDYFDYIAGSGTAGFLAAGLCRGMSVTELSDAVNAFLTLVFNRASSESHNTLSRDLLLRKIFGGATLEPAWLTSLLLLVLSNATTGLAWPLSSNPSAKYNNPSRQDANNRIPLWQLVRANTSLLFGATSEILEIMPSRTTAVTDGSLAGYGNPAFLLYQMATEPAYGLGWKSSERDLLLVSVGTGFARDPSPPKEGQFANVTGSFASILESVSVAQDLNCRTVGRCAFGPTLDREVGALTTSRPLSEDLGRAYLYVRYQPDTPMINDMLSQVPPIDHEGPDKYPIHFQRFYDDVGRKAAKAVDLAHFGSFV